MRNFYFAPWSRLPLPLLIGVLACHLLPAALPEPDIVFYGRIVHLGGGEEYVLTAGELMWTVAPGDEQLQDHYVATAPLQPLSGGMLSYQIRIPATRVVADTSPGVMPGLITDSTTDQLPFRNTSIVVNGMRTRLADAASSTFLVNPLLRGSHRRMDLIVEGALPDSDGDGIPDWWELKYGTGWDVANADADPDNDGISNVQEYLAGTYPTRPNSAPTLPASIMVSLPQYGKAVLMIRPVDEDSSPEQLIYSVGTLPPGIQLHRAASELPVAIFDHTDVLNGNILIAHTDTDSTANEFTLTLRDESPTNPPRHYNGVPCDRAGTGHLARPRLARGRLAHAVSCRPGCHPPERQHHLACPQQPRQLARPAAIGSTC
jgi:hypothetical protein